jgi:4-hydroxybenzoate polyprenyltransferase
MNLSHENRALAVFRSVRLAWLEARPVVQLIFMLRFTAGVVLSSGAVQRVVEPAVAVAMLAWLAATWAIYLLNGVADLVEDRGNASTRPIASGRLSTGVASRFVVALAAFALFVAAVVSLRLLVLVVLMLVVGGAYSVGPYPLKRSMTGFLFSVGALGLLTYLAGWCAVGVETPNRSLLLFGAAMSIWMGTAGSTKDLSDVRGDRLAGRRTPPLVLGEGRARVMIAILAGLDGCSFLISALTWIDPLVPAATAVCAGAAMIAAAVLSPFSRGDRGKQRRPYRIFMVTQYYAHVTLLL